MPLGMFIVCGYNVAPPHKAAACLLPSFVLYDETDSETLISSENDSPHCMSDTRQRMSRNEWMTHHPFSLPPSLLN